MLLVPPTAVSDDNVYDISAIYFLPSCIASLKEYLFLKFPKHIMSKVAWIGLA